MTSVHAGDLFELLRDGRPWTRAQLAQTTGLARSTVATRIEELMRLGLVAPSDGVSTGGRPASLFAVNPRARVVAGVDVGATHVVVGLTDLSGVLLGEREVALDVAEGPATVLGWVSSSVSELLVECGRPRSDLAGIGMGLPGPVEHSTGRPTNPPIMPGWDRYDVPGHLQRTHPVPVLIDNDVNIMALGEREAVYPDVADLVYVKVATGIGAGIISGGALQRGAQGTAGDLGHVRVADHEDVACRCGNVACLEAVAAGPAVAAAIRRAGGEARSTLDVVELTRGGDVVAVQAVRQASGTAAQQRLGT